MIIGCHDLARLLVAMRLMMHLATRISTPQMASQIQDQEDKLIAALAAYPDLKPATDGYARNCLQEITDGRNPDPNDPESLLLHILNCRAQDNSKKDAESSPTPESETG